MESVATAEPGLALQFDRDTGLLLPSESPYRLSLSDVYRIFVEEAPYADERHLTYSLLAAYLQQTREIVPDRKVWVNGSFISHIKERPPSDVDLALLVNAPTNAQRKALVSLGLLTMSDVRAKVADKDMPTIPRLAPYGGQVDSYFVNADIPSQVKLWDLSWSTPKGPDGELDLSQSKGYVEVIESE